jgi:hypothetical protein
MEMCISFQYLRMESMCINFQYLRMESTFAQDIVTNISNISDWKKKNNL